MGLVPGRNPDRPTKIAEGIEKQADPVIGKIRRGPGADVADPGLAHQMRRRSRDHGDWIACGRTTRYQGRVGLSQNRVRKPVK